MPWRARLALARLVHDGTNVERGSSWTRIVRKCGTKFVDLGIKSVQVSQLTTYLEDELDIEVPFMKFRRCETFGAATDFVCELLDE